MADVMNFLQSYTSASPFDSLPGGGFSGGEGASGLMPGLPTVAPSFAPTALDPSSFPSTSSIDRSLDASLGSPPQTYAGGGGLPYNIPAPYAPPGGGTLAPPDVTVAGVPAGITPAAVASAGLPYSPGGIELDEAGRVVQGGGAGAQATSTYFDRSNPLYGEDNVVPPTAAAPAAPPAAAAPAQAPAAPQAAIPTATAPATAEDPMSWVLSPAGSRYLAEQAIAKAGGPVSADPGGFLQRNLIDPFKKSGIGELLGIGVPAAGLIKQLASMSGGQTPLSPLQQEQLNAMRAQRGQAEQFMTGAVTPQMEQNFQNQTKAEIQQIKARYAQMRMSGSTAEMQDIAAAQARGTARLGQAQGQMIATGASMLGLPAGYMQKISNEQLAQDAAFNDALARFVASIAGSPPTKAA